MVMLVHISETLWKMSIYLLLISNIEKCLLKKTHGVLPFS